ncbi:MAG: cyclic nucleotide-binding domain-containing protein [Clostridia bacterium]|nr:cyclic nucleotide-binding domain-containing protein [Clostridia bacterium]
MNERVFTKGQVIFREGDLGESFFHITEGKAGVYLHYGEAEERKLTEMLPGQYIGEMAVINAWPRSATVVAEEDLKAIEIGETELNDYFSKYPEKILSIMKQIGGRIRTLTEEYDEVTAFLKEKQDAAATKDSGFLARIRKYREISEAAKKAKIQSAEEKISIREFANSGKGLLPVTQYYKGTIIFRQGETGNYMYAVQSGSVGIYTNYGTDIEKKLTSLYANSFFGEMSLLDMEARSATAVAEEDGTSVEIIRPEDLEKLFQSNPAEVDMILSHLSNRLRSLTVDYVKACEKATAED